METENSQQPTLAEQVAMLKEQLNQAQKLTALGELVGSQKQQGADKDPIADFVVPARVAARDAVDTGVVEPLRLAGTFHAQDHEADDEEGAENVEEQRVDEIVGLF